ncbi:hypothetical protein AV530_014580 [Patagioenas fasciata monilis]|uniref:Uncharacterized protein n=1 Tax=Patagioenas fasciata monilis TaxID=372326 RepID=A0A1V4KCH0_PATFA|nr:hypothetical protein AV530_014580 [Patagioenas fasciata monilis]
MEQTESCFFQLTRAARWRQRWQQQLGPWLGTKGGIWQLVPLSSTWLLKQAAGWLQTTVLKMTCRRLLCTLTFCDSSGLCP